MGFWNDKEILITGGTGSLGKEIIRLMLTKYQPKGIRIYSRGEELQRQLEVEVKKVIRSNVPISFLIGDVRDYYRLEMAMMGVDVVFHTAALKQIPACERNPIEAIMTNIIGARNVLRAAISTRVEKVMNISTDKAVQATNLYGVTKAAAEKLFIHGNTYSSGRFPHFSCCRYGNVLGSRGSVFFLFKEQAKEGIITITDRRMTRFWIKLETVAEFLIHNTERMKGGEIYIPKMPSANVIDIAKIISPDSEIKEIGIRQGEKLHEILICKEESENIIETVDKYIITNEKKGHVSFTYTSEYNPWTLGKKELEDMINEVNKTKE